MRAPAVDTEEVALLDEPGQFVLGEVARAGQGLGAGVGESPPAGFQIRQLGGVGDQGVDFDAVFVDVGAVYAAGSALWDGEGRDQGHEPGEKDQSSDDGHFVRLFSGWK